ncbi:MAG: CAP-associated domain-containing protein [Clostridiales bacterium]
MKNKKYNSKYLSNNNQSTGKKKSIYQKFLNKFKNSNYFCINKKTSVILMVIITFTIFTFIVFSSSNYIDNSFISFTNYTDTPHKKTMEPIKNNDINNNSKSTKNKTMQPEISSSNKSKITTPKPTNNQSDENPIEDDNIRLKLESIIGLEEDFIIKFFGNPDRVDLSENNHKWYIYNSDYSKFIMIGILDNKCVSFYTNTSFYSIFYDIKVGVPTNKLNEMGLKSDSNNRTTWKNEISNIVVFHNPKRQNSISGIYVYSQTLNSSEYNKEKDYSKNNLLESFETQFFDILNAFNAENHLFKLKWHDSCSDISCEINKSLYDLKPKDQNYLDSKLSELNLTGSLENYSSNNPIYLFETFLNNTNIDLYSQEFIFFVGSISPTNDSSSLNLSTIFIKNMVQ